MSWTVLEPIIRTVPAVRARIRVIRSGAFLNLSFSDGFYKDLGRPKAADLLAGDGELLGKLLLKPNPKGKFPMSEYVKGGAHVVLPLFRGLPDTERNAEACLVEKVAEGWIIAMPVLKWQEQAKQPRPAPAPENGKALFEIDLYLKKKGHRVTRLSSVLFMIDGERSTLSRALAIANGHRKKEELPLLAEGDVA